MSLEQNSRIKKSETVLQFMRPLKRFFDDPEVFEVSINREKEVWTSSFGSKQCHKVEELTYKYLIAMARAIIVYNGDKPAPINSVILPGGERGQIILPPTAMTGYIGMNFRKHSITVKTLEELAEEKVFDGVRDVSFNKPTHEEAINKTKVNDFTRLDDFEVDLLKLKREIRIAEFLEMAVQKKRNIVVVGKTGSGKTTVTRALIKKVPLDEKILTVEDVHELFIDHQNHLPMIYTSSTNKNESNKKGKSTASECLAAAMRLLPDRIFLAELRKDEAWDYICSVSNTGHPGSITTVHADSAILAFNRIAMLIKQSEVGKMLDMELIKMTLYTAIDVVLFFHERKLIEIFYDPFFKKQHLV